MALAPSQSSPEHHSRRHQTLADVVMLLMAASVAMVLSGCDGHLRMMYLQEPSATATPQYAGVRVVKISGDLDALSIVEHVALQMSLVQDLGRDNTWSSDGFVLRAVQEEEHLWRIEMLDWPSFTRSDLSRVVEEKIVQRVRESQEQVGWAPPALPFPRSQTTSTARPRRL